MFCPEAQTIVAKRTLKILFATNNPARPRMQKNMKTFANMAEVSTWQYSKDRSGGLQMAAL